VKTENEEVVKMCFNVVGVFFFCDDVVGELNLCNCMNTN
jgi:hypothetical protein